MLKKGAALLYGLLLVSSLLTLGFAQGAAKEARVEGRIAYHDKDKSMFSVRTEHSQTTVFYDPSTEWVSQYHGEQKVNTIDASQVKDGDYVICVGSYDDKKEFHATKVSKRLSHSSE
jgi:Cellulase N-terminal ig-like domain